jgi:D-sedoheptulose 7-phosphate isomerase
MNSKVKPSEILEIRFSEFIDLIPQFKNDCTEQILAAANLIMKAYDRGAKLLICGNGGSAADSQHLAAEFVSSFSKSIKRRALPAIALTVDTSIITAYSNDFSFNHVFERQVEAYGVSGDVLIILSTSGESINCINAAKKARQSGIFIIAFTKYHSKLSDLSDVSIEIPSNNTQHIQELHMLAYHIIVEIVEVELFGIRQ